MAQAAQRLAGKLPGMVKGTQTFAKPRWEKFMKYARVELRPPSAADVGEASKGLNGLVASFRTGKWKQVTIPEALVNMAVCAEVGCWFFLGEILGKRTLIGYQVVGGVHAPLMAT